MAKLKPDSSARSLAAAVTAMSLGTGRRLMRNFSYYATPAPGGSSRSACLTTYRDFRANVFALQNLYLDHDTADTSAFKVMLAKQIQDNLEELHRELLFFEVDCIEPVIPVLDRLRAFWNQSTEPEFYGDNLPQAIDREVCSVFSELQRHLKKLPRYSEG